MTPDRFIVNGIIPAMSMLPQKMDSPEARAMLIAIALQESRLRFRKQIGGPARGYLQFEQGGGVKGVLNHEKTAGIATQVCLALDVQPASEAVYEAITHNDCLAVVFGRLLLYTLPWPLPDETESEKGWQQYISGWRPGKPHPETWPKFYEQAWNYV